jgi:hypothetical protein
MNGCFQFFFSSKRNDLPHADIPTRDVTNTCKMGNKTEPHFEKMMENWCPCRARSVAVAVKRALRDPMHHCMVLTTNHPRTNAPLAVGVLYFSREGYGEAVARHRGRWNNEKYLPYVGSERSKLVSFGDAFRLASWMDTHGKRHLPGKRYGIVNAPPDLLHAILPHFMGSPNQIRRFLGNVEYLETILKRDDPDAWEDYAKRNGGDAYKSSRCSISAITKAQC